MSNRGDNRAELAPSGKLDYRALFMQETPDRGPQWNPTPLIAIATQCFSPDVGGIETLMTGLADQLSLSGLPVEVFADHVRSAGAIELTRPYPIHRFGSIRPLRRVMKRRAIARVAANGGVAGLFADSWKSIAAAPADVGPIAVLAHGTEFPLEPSPDKALRINAALKRARCIVANSRYTAGLAARFMQGAVAEVIVVNPPLPDLPKPQLPALAEIDAMLEGRGPVLVTLARLEPRKGVDSVIRALPELRRKHPRLAYFVAGAGPDLERLRALASSLHVEDCVVFLGEVTDLDKKAALLTRSDVYAMPSRRVGNSVEGFGIAYVEAAWYGVPSVAGGDAGAVDAVVDNRTGLLCDSASDDDVRSALSRLLDDQALRDRLGAAAADLARAKHSWAGALPRYLQAIGR
jgi:phosphatidyl-myo-inositol dimannoside synthase